MKIQCYVSILVILIFVAASGCRGDNGNIAPGFDQKILACFTFNDPVDCIVNEPVEFGASCSVDSFFEIVKFVWEWGDESVSETTVNPLTNHVFSSIGTYEVTVTITDLAGFTDSTTQTVEIIPPGSPPSATFWYVAPDGFQPGSEILFDASGSSDPEGGTLSYSWDFGDGRTLDDQDEPEAGHEYDLESDVEITLTITDQDGWVTESDPVRLSFGWPLGPPIVANLELFGNARDVEVQGNYAYVADESGGVVIVDLTNPSSPQVVSRETTHNPRVIDVADGIAVVYSFFNRVSVVDVSDPFNPLDLGYCSIETSGVTEIVIDGTKAYVGCNACVHIIDISDPETPEVVWTLDLEFGKGSIMPDGQYLYVAGEEYIHIFDTEDPGGITEVASYGIPINYYHRSVKSGNLIYGVYKLGEMSIIDVSDPYNPFEASTARVNGIGPVVVSGSLLIVYIGSFIEYLDITDPLNPVILGYTPEPFLDYSANYFNIAVYENYLVMAGGDLGIFIYDISDPSGPLAVSYTEIEQSDTMASYNCIRADRNHAYISTTSYGLHVADIRDPYNPQIIASLPFTERFVVCGISGDTIIGRTYPDYSVVAIDIRDPFNPVVTDVIDGLVAWNISVDGNYAYTVNGDTSAFTVIDISDPHNLEVTGETWFIMSSRSSIVYGDYVFLTTATYYENPGFLEVFDVSDPYNPQHVNMVEIPAPEGKTSYSSAVVGIYDQTLYNYILNDGSYNMVAMDISDPEVPFPAATFREHFDSDSIISGRFAFTPLGNITVVDLIDPLAPATVSFAGVDSLVTKCAIEGDLLYCVNTQSSTIELIIVELW